MHMVKKRMLKSSWMMGMIILAFLFTAPSFSSSTATIIPLTRSGGSWFSTFFRSSQHLRVAVDSFLTRFLRFLTRWSTQMWITMIRTMLRMYHVLYMSMYLKSAVVGSFDLTELRKAEEKNIRIILGGNYEEKLG